MSMSMSMNMTYTHVMFDDGMAWHGMAWQAILESASHHVKTSTAFDVHELTSVPPSLSLSVPCV